MVDQAGSSLTSIFEYQEQGGLYSADIGAIIRFIAEASDGNPSSRHGVLTYELGSLEMVWGSILLHYPFPPYGHSSGGGCCLIPRIFWQFAGD